MNGDSNQGTITAVPDGWALPTEDRFRQIPTLLKPSAGTYSCYIFRVPKSRVDSNANAYKPRIVSVGPYHHGQEELKLIEEHKPRVFHTMLYRTIGGTGAGPIDYFKAIASRETHIRESYSETLNWKTSDLIEMMIFDACFIIELFRTCTGVIPQDPHDPLFSTPWIVSHLMLDLLLIENQIPIFVLQEIYKLSKSPSDGDCFLNGMALKFFNLALQWPEENLQKHYEVSNITHLLDLFRLCWVGHLNIEPVFDKKDFLQLLPSANQLLLAGIKFEERKESKNLIEVEFDHGMLRIPPLTLDHFTCSFFLNCVAYEQCYHYCSKHISSYVVLMSCLMSTAADAAVLSQHGIFANFLGTNEEAAKFFNDVAKDVQFDIKFSYVAEIFRKVNQYSQNKWRLRWAGIKREYFGSPWSFISAAPAFTLLVLTIVQTFFTVYPYYHLKK